MVGQLQLSEQRLASSERVLVPESDSTIVTSEPAQAAVNFASMSADEKAALLMSVSLRRIAECGQIFRAWSAWGWWPSDSVARCMQVMEVMPGELRARLVAVMETAQALDTPQDSSPATIAQVPSTPTKSSAPNPCTQLARCI